MFTSSRAMFITSPLAASGKAVATTAASTQLMQRNQQKLLASATVGSGGRSSVAGVRAAVFGCGGFLGRYVVNNLGKKGTQVLVPYRGDSYDVRFLKVMGDVGMINPMPFAIRDYDSIMKVIRNVDVVYNLIGRDYETGNFSFEDVHVTGAQTIARACREAGVARLIHVSALNASEDSESRFLQTKAAGETAVLAEYPEAIIVRPATMFGHEDRFLNRIGYFHRYLGFPGDWVINGGAQRIQPVAAGDVANALATMLRDPDLGNFYEFVGPKEYTYAEVLDHFGAVTFRNMNPITVPAFALKTMAHFFKYIPPSPRLCTDEVIRMTIDDEVSENSLGLESLGITPTKLEDVSLQFIRRYRPADVLEA